MEKKQIPRVLQKIPQLNSVKKLVWSAKRKVQLFKTKSTLD